MKNDERRRKKTDHDAASTPSAPIGSLDGVTAGVARAAPGSVSGVVQSAHLQRVDVVAGAGGVTEGVGAWRYLSRCGFGVADATDP